MLVFQMHNVDKTSTV
ncbi:23S rRNA methyltransferase attenuation leader peptide [Streptococcus salivarius]